MFRQSGQTLGADRTGGSCRGVGGHNRWVRVGVLRSEFVCTVQCVTLCTSSYSFLTHSTHVYIGPEVDGSTQADNNVFTQAEPSIGLQSLRDRRQRIDHYQSWTFSCYSNHLFFLLPPWLPDQLMKPSFEQRIQDPYELQHRKGAVTYIARQQRTSYIQYLPVCLLGWLNQCNLFYTMMLDPIFLPRPL